MIRMATGHTLKLALGLAIILTRVSAYRAPLARISGIYFYNISEFIIAVLIEPTPSGVLDHSVQTCLCLDVLAGIFYRALRGLGHIPDLQVLPHERLRSVGQCSAMVVGDALPCILLLAFPLGDLPLGHASTV